MNEHAKRYYDEIRERKSDVAQIAANTGYDVSIIDIIKNHLFLMCMT
ncbi:hypothetical protein FACS1894133_6870 [Clostridia bacterium]|nr:hypothetical protein FACS1894133_6870 [Clostridia bacterium]